MQRTMEKTKLAGPLLALDLGQKRVGVAVSDALLISVTKLPPLGRSNWKQLLTDVRVLIKRFSVKALVVGFPLGLDGSEGQAAGAVHETAEKFALSLGLPVYLQDERLTSVEAEDQLRAAGRDFHEIRQLIDGQAAAIILTDFMAGGQDRVLVSRQDDGKKASR
ncbi:MAG: Holliday junction resolvase RuvX [Acidobacteriota bacterium]